MINRCCYWRIALAYGVQTDVKDKNGQTAADVARSTAIRKLLLVSYPWRSSSAMPMVVS